MNKLILFPFLYLTMVVNALPENFDSVVPRRVDAMERVFAFYQAKQSIASTDIDTENDLVGPCKPVTMIFARGTGETGNVGSMHSPGPALFSELRRALGRENISVQGVNYNANVLGYLRGGDAEGSLNFYNLTTEAISKCPETKVVLSGYSQGAQLLHNSARWFESNTTSKVTAVVVFGDPYSHVKVGDVPTTNVLNICHSRDIICDGLSGSAAAHLTYSKDAAEATRFIMNQLKGGEEKQMQK